MPPQRLDREPVPYPAGGRGEASVALIVVVDSSGGVSDVQVHDGPSPFVDVAAAAVRTWRFLPATRDDVAVAARVMVRVDFHPPTAQPLLEEPTPPPQAPAAPAPAPDEPIDVSVKGQREEPSAIHIPRTEVRLVAGAFGDPFRIVEALPGMAPWTSGLPYYYVRGSPPESVGYFIDGIRIPLLFHVGAGPSTMAPALVESVDLFPGAYPARYGRMSGAVVAGETTAPSETRARGEFAARFYDANAFVETPIDGGRGTVLAAARYAYTAPLISLFAPNYSLGYWDYQLRATHRVSDRDTVTLFAFGAHDELHYNGQPQFSIEYHRVDLRLDHRIRGGSLRVAFTFSQDHTLTADTDVGQSAALDGPGWRLRMELDQHVDRKVRIRAGADVGATRFTADEYPAQGAFPALHGPHTDVEGGAYADVVWYPAKPLEVVPGFRLDGYRSRDRSTWAPQPRLAAKVRLHPALSWLSAFGTAHQEPTEAVFLPAALPNPMDESARTSAQLSEGLEVRLPSSMRLRATGFYSRTLAPQILGTPVSGLEQGEGLEVFFHRDLTERLGGFVSYTLSRTDRAIGSVTERAPWDRTHVLTVVAGYDLGARWRAGARFFFESGRPFTQPCGGSAGDLPPFYRIDARVEKKWVFRGGPWLAASLEGFNVTDQAEPIGSDCVNGKPSVQYQTPIILPTLGLEGGF